MQLRRGQPPPPSSANRSACSCVLVFALAGCGGASGAIFGTGSGPGTTNTPSVIGGVVVGDDPNDARASPLHFTFRLIDAESDTSDVDVFVVPPGGGAPFPAQLVGDTNLTALAATPGGTAHERAWDFESQLATSNAFAAGYALRVQIAGQGSGATSPSFSVGNDPAVIPAVSVPSGTSAGSTEVDLVLVDSSGDPITVLVEYDDLSDPFGWQPATPIGPGLVNVASSPTGVPQAFLWSSDADAPGREFDARLRFTANDGTEPSTPVLSPVFHLDNNALESLSALVVGASATDAKLSPLAFSFRITDTESDPVDVEVLVTPPAGLPVPAVLTGGSSLTALASSPAGTLHSFAWDFAAQLGSGAYVPGFTLTVRTTDGASSVTSPPFDVGNDAAVVADIQVPPDQTAGIAVVAFTLADSSSDVASVTVEYDDVDDADGWKPATLVGTLPMNLAATPAGIPVVVFWNVGADEPGLEFTARMRFTADDGSTPAAPVESVTFVLDNNVAPHVQVNGSAFFATSDQRRGLALPLIVGDAESDAVRLVVQWRTPFGTCPALPASSSALDAILGSRAARAQYRIATARPVAWTGSVATPTATSARLPELHAGAAGLAVPGLVGRELQLLRRSAVPSALAAGWSTNPLTAPVALLPATEPARALVLDAPTGQSWSLSELDLATGATVRTIASGAQGGAEALCFDFDPDRVLIAVDAGGTWTLLRIDLATGAATVLITTNGSTAVGAVHGLASTGAETAVLTVDDALVAIDATDPLAPAERVLLSGLQAPQGIVLDPHRSDRLYLAERDWVNPASSAVEGRVVVIDLRTLELESIVATAAPLLHPVAVTLEDDGARLLALTDANTGDGTRELRAVSLGGESSGGAFEVGAGYPDDAAGLATGPLGLRMFALPGTADLAAGGGVEQSRTITAWDVTTCTVTVGGAFAPALDVRQRWRIADDVDVVATSSTGIERVFVWDSDDLVDSNQVVLRVTPYDSERGTPQDTGVPRPVRMSLDVDADSLGGPGSTSGATGIAAADLNGDGLLDLASSNVGSDELTIFFGDSQGSFPSTPDVALQGVAILAPMTDPVAVRAVDVDSDGDLDLVSANRGSNNFTVFKQTTPGNYSIQLLSLGTGANSPSDVAAGDLNGDGRIDLATSNTGSDRVTLFYQQIGGLYLPLASVTLGDATTDAPSGVAVADLDGDGDLDVVSSNANSDNVTLFHQTSPGVFAAAPSATLGGTGVTDGPAGIAVGDVNGDGRADIACANESGNDVTIFLQSASGTFGTTPDFRLTHALGPTQPKQVRLADVNGDGALDVVTLDGDDEVSTFVNDPGQGRFSAQPTVVDGGGAFSGPASIALGDFDGDGQLDAALSNTTSSSLAVLLQRRGGTYTRAGPDLTLGGAAYTPGAAGVAVADLDGDGRLDIASANENDDSISVFHQFSPAVFGALPAATIGSTATTNGARALAAGDLDGDGRVDLVSANRNSGNLAVFLQASDGTFTSTPQFLLGAGLLGAPSAVVVADLDDDGDLDLANANATGDDVTLFLQGSPGAFGSAPDFTLGSAATLDEPVDLIAADLDQDGDQDLAVAAKSSSRLVVFLQTAPGSFAAVPSASLGSAGTTTSPRAVVAADLDGDGGTDLASANGNANSVTLFFQTTPGVFPALPNATLTSASMTTPTTLAAGDVDGNGLVDLVSGNSGSDDLALFRQTSPGVFASSAERFGTSGTTPSPVALHFADVDGDGDVDLVLAQPELDAVSIFFGSH